MALSTCARSVVGTWTSAMPRMYVAAQKPARSPTTPPPSAITTEVRSSPPCANSSSSVPARSQDFDGSPAGTTCSLTRTPASAVAMRQRVRRTATPRWRRSRARRCGPGHLADVVARRVESSPAPTRTWYASAAVPATRTRHARPTGSAAITASATSVGVRPRRCRPRDRPLPDRATDGVQGCFGQPPARLPPADGRSPASPSRAIASSGVTER